MPEIIDTAEPANRHLPALAARGVKSVIRYLSRAGGDKVITVSEAKALAANGLQIGLVYELYGGSAGLARDITAAYGHLDGIYCLQAAKNLGAPQGTVIYFAVDTDVSNDAQVNAYIVPYFKAAVAALHPYYRVGVYGCGSTCAAALDSAGVDKAWLSNATGWTGYKAFYASKRWSLLQQRDTVQGGIDYDPDIAGEEDWGAFTPTWAVPEAGSVEWVQTKLNALLMSSPPLVIDGIVGPATKAALLAFQKIHVIPQTGAVDDTTVATMKGLS